MNAHFQRVAQHFRAFFQLFPQLALFRDVRDVDVDHEVDRIAAHPVDAVRVDLEPRVLTLAVLDLHHKMGALARQKARTVFGDGLAVALIVHIDEGIGRIVRPALAEEADETFIGPHEMEARGGVHPELGHEARQVVVGDGLLHLRLDEIADVGEHRVDDGDAAKGFVGEGADDLYPDERAVLVRHLAHKGVARLPFGEGRVHGVGDFGVLGGELLKIFAAMVMVGGFILFFGVARFLVKVIVGPDNGKILVEQMLAYADAQGAHEHVVFGADGRVRGVEHKKPVGERGYGWKERGKENFP